MTAAVTVVGLDGGPLRERALVALRRADTVVGARRHLDAVAHLLPARAHRAELTGDLATLLTRLAGASGQAVVLASGDPGFFGILRTLAAACPAVAAVPAVSSVAAAFAHAGLSWDDAVVVSAHGRDPRPAVNACRRFPKVAVLTEPAFGPAELAGALDGLRRRLVVAERLGSAEERVVELSREEVAGQAFADPNVVLVLDAEAPPGERGSVFPARRTPPGWALPEQAFDHRFAPGSEGSGPRSGPGSGGSGPRSGPGSGGSGPRSESGSGGSGPRSESGSGGSGPRSESGSGGSGPRSESGSGGSGPRSESGSGGAGSGSGQITKAEVRAVALAWLGPGVGDLVWDVGAGSGSVAVECSRFGAAVVAVDADPEQCERIRANARRHGAPVTVVQGCAPAALAGLPDPDAVFVGGGGQLLSEIIRAAAGRAPRVVVVALATVERVAAAQRALGGAGLEVDGTMVQACRLAPLGEGQRLAALNPVFLLRGARK